MHTINAPVRCLHLERWLNHRRLHYGAYLINIVHRLVSGWGSPDVILLAVWNFLSVTCVSLAVLLPTFSKNVFKGKDKHWPRLHDTVLKHKKKKKAFYKGGNPSQHLHMSWVQLLFRLLWGTEMNSKVFCTNRVTVGTLIPPRALHLNFKLIQFLWIYVLSVEGIQQAPAKKFCVCLYGCAF